MSDYADYLTGANKLHVSEFPFIAATVIIYCCNKNCITNAKHV